MFFFFKQKTAYEMRISDWSSDVCASDLFGDGAHRLHVLVELQVQHRTHVQRADRGMGIPGAVGAVPVEDLGEAAGILGEEIGSASCRERVCPYVSISVVAVYLKKQQSRDTTINTIHQTTITHD